jgi:hypothetical protein
MWRGRSVLLEAKRVPSTDLWAIRGKIIGVVIKARI